MLNIYKLKQSNIKKDSTIKNEGISVKEPKYNPAFSREWYSSVYTFNKNTIKYLPSYDAYVSKLIKIHFNLFSNKLESKANLYSNRLGNRILKVNRIFIAKPEFKHTNDRVIITLYVYNQELINYKNKIDKISGLGFLKLFNIKASNNKTKYKYKLHTIKNLYTKFVKNIKNLNNKYLSKVDNNFYIEKFSLLVFIRKMLTKLRLYIHIKKIIHVNKSKFNSIHILFLRNLLRRIYGKNVEFNIVNLKNYRLNTSIFTQILAIKMIDKKNNPPKFINKVLKGVILPYSRLLDIPYKTYNLKKQNLIIRNTLNNNYTKKIPYLELSDTKNPWTNEIGLSDYILSKVFIKKVKTDKLNNYLNYLYPKEYLIKLSRSSELFIKSRNLENTVLDNIKNKVISGIKIESSGRLGKRLTGRALAYSFQKGSIKNVYSSYRGVSSVLLRGNLNYNLDYNKSNNIGKVGSFGLKGWISSI